MQEYKFKLSKREIWLYSIATVAFILGWGLTIWGFLVEPVGEVHTSVQFILGQALVFTAASFGISLYFNGSLKEFKSDMTKMMDDKISKLEDK